MEIGTEGRKVREDKGVRSLRPSCPSVWDHENLFDSEYLDGVGMDGAVGSFRRDDDGNCLAVF
jgi:hypothetical protein